jgi:hypothetical protein
MAPPTLLEVAQLTTLLGIKLSFGFTSMVVIHLLSADLWVQYLRTCQEGGARILPQSLLCCYSTIRTTVVERVNFL